MSAHDRWLANYHQHPATVYCTNPKCSNHHEGATVTYVSEYGQGWYEPEECESCGGEWLEDAPPDATDDDLSDKDSSDDA